MSDRPPCRDRRCCTGRGPGGVGSGLGPPRALQRDDADPAGRDRRAARRGVQATALGPSGEIVHELLELTLAVLLFVDATEVSAGWLRESARYPLRLLGMGFPLTVAA